MHLLLFTLAVCLMGDQALAQVKVYPNLGGMQMNRILALFHAKAAKYSQEVNVARLKVETLMVELEREMDDAKQETSIIDGTADNIRAYFNGWVDSLRKRTQSIERNAGEVEVQQVAFQAFLDKSDFAPDGAEYEDIKNPGDYIQNIAFQRSTVNIAKGYDHKTGVFTVPVDGVYLLAARVSTARRKGAAIWEIVKYQPNNDASRLFPNIDCYREGHADEYRGRQSVTITGKQCQRWAEQSPEAHSSGDQPDEFIDGVFPGNYCRHPLRDNYKTEPWCYTLEPYTQYEMCGIPICTDEDDPFGEGNEGEVIARAETLSLRQDKDAVIATSMVKLNKGERIMVRPGLGTSARIYLGDNSWFMGILLRPRVSRPFAQPRGLLIPRDRFTGFGGEPQNSGGEFDGPPTIEPQFLFGYPDEDDGSGNILRYPDEDGGSGVGMPGPTSATQPTTPGGTTPAGWA